MKGLEPDTMTAYPALTRIGLCRQWPSYQEGGEGRGGPGVRNPVFWLTLGWTVTHEPMLRGKPVILWHVVPLLLRGFPLETQRFTQVSIPFCVVADTSARGSVEIGSARKWRGVRSALRGSCRYIGPFPSVPPNRIVQRFPFARSFSGSWAGTTGF